MSLAPVINIIGKSRAGKDSVFKTIHPVLAPAYHAKFSSPMKRCIETLYDLPLGSLETQEVRQAIVPGDPDGITFLELMVRTSKHWRACSPGIMLHSIGRDIQKVNPDHPIVFTDCRFVNELSFIYSLGRPVITLSVVRKGLSTVESDSELPTLVNKAFVRSWYGEGRFINLYNFGTLEDLEIKALEALEEASDYL